MKQKTTNKKNPKAKATKEKTLPAPPRNATDLTAALDKLKPTPQQLLEGQAEALQSIAKESAPTVKQLAYIAAKLAPSITPPATASDPQDYQAAQAAKLAYKVWQASVLELIERSQEIFKRKSNLAKPRSPSHFEHWMSAGVHKFPLTLERALQIWFPKVKAAERLNLFRDFLNAAKQLTGNPIAQQIAPLDYYQTKGFQWADWMHCSELLGSWLDWRKSAARSRAARAKHQKSKPQ